MKLLIGDKGRLDFSSPLEVTKGQKNDFITFLKTLFEPSIVLEKELVNERDKRLGDLKVFQSTWDTEEEAFLLNSNKKDTLGLSNALGRSWMSVDIRFGGLIADFNLWKQKNNEKDNPNISELIQKFLKSRKSPPELKELKEKIKNTKDWFRFIKKENDILLNKFEPKPDMKLFRRAIRELKKDEEFIKLYKENYFD
jgi:hypothetical protein